MKLVALFIMAFASISFGQIRTYKTQCKNQDCFRYGWITTSEKYSMDTVCKNQSCGISGWSSLASDRSTYDVSCLPGGCFHAGWNSMQQIKERTYLDSAHCNAGNCLRFGWTVETGYDWMGGNVICTNGDCSRFGGQSFWRGRPSRTVCFNNDCYKYGWTLYVY